MYYVCIIKQIQEDSNSDTSMGDPDEEEGDVEGIAFVQVIKEEDSKSPILEPIKDSCNKEDRYGDRERIIKEGGNNDVNPDPWSFRMWKINFH